MQAMLLIFTNCGNRKYELVTVSILSRKLERYKIHLECREGIKTWIIVEYSSRLAGSCRLRRLALLFSKQIIAVEAGVTQQ